MRSKYLTHDTKKATYGILADDFERFVERECDNMVAIKTKRCRLEAIETAYEAVAKEADVIASTWDIENDKLKYRTIEEMDEDEQIRYKAYQDFLKELEKLA